jgi:hypothetical protein
MEKSKKKVFLSISDKASIDSWQEAELLLKDKYIVMQRNFRKKNPIWEADMVVIIPPYSQYAKIEKNNLICFIVGRGNFRESYMNKNVYVFHHNKFYSIIDKVKYPENRRSWDKNFGVLICNIKSYESI